MDPGVIILVTTLSQFCQQMYPGAVAGSMNILGHFRARRRVSSVAEWPGLATR